MTKIFAKARWRN